MEIDKKSPVPIYFQLKQIITDNIRKKVWTPGTAIYSERELSEMFQVSRMTIRQAINELVNDGVLYRERGKGTFVAEPKIEQSDIMSFTEAATNKGFEASTIVKSFEINMPDLSIVEKLDLPYQEDVYYIQRLRMINNQLIGIEEIYLPITYCPGLKDKDLSGSLYNLLKENYNITIDHIKTSLEAIIPEKGEADLFEEYHTTPLLKVKSINISNNNIKLYYEESVYRSDKYVLNFTLNRS